jgi:hypothetical protein
MQGTNTRARLHPEHGWDIFGKEEDDDEVGDTTLAMLLPSHFNTKKVILYKRVLFTGASNGNTKRLPVHAFPALTCAFQIT